MFLLVGGVGAGVMLTQQNQNIEEKAALAGTCVCKKPNGTNAGNGTCEADFSCTCPAGTEEKSNNCRGGGLPPGDTQNQRCQELIDRCDRNGDGSIDDEGNCVQEWISDCDGWGGGGGGEGCPPGTTYICETPPVIDCVNNQSECIFPQRFTGWQDGDETPSCHAQYSDKDGKQFCQTNCSCKSISVPTPSTSPVSAQCQNLAAFSITGNNTVPLTQAQLSTMKPGDQFNLCVRGTKTGGAFDKVRFTINGILQPEQPMNDRLGTTTEGQFCMTYIIPKLIPTGGRFNFKAEMHHTTLGWK